MTTDQKEPITPDTLHDILGLVLAKSGTSGGIFDIDTSDVPPVGVLDLWGPEDREAARAWAAGVHFRASDNDNEIPAAPQVLKDWAAARNIYLPDAEGYYHRWDVEYEKPWDDEPGTVSVLRNGELICDVTEFDKDSLGEWDEEYMEGGDSYIPKYVRVSADTALMTRGAQGVLSEYMRWVPLKATSPSGKTLFVCKDCGRQSCTPDKTCPSGYRVVSGGETTIHRCGNA